MKLPHFAYKILWTLKMCPRIDGEWVNISGRHLYQYINPGMKGCGFYPLHHNKDEKPLNIFRVKSYSEAYLNPFLDPSNLEFKKRNWMGIFR